MRKPQLTIRLLCVGAGVALAGIAVAGATVLHARPDGRVALSTDEVVTISLACSDRAGAAPSDHTLCVRRQIQGLKDHPAPGPAARKSAAGQAFSATLPSSEHGATPQAIAAAAPPATAPPPAPSPKAPSGLATSTALTDPCITKAAASFGVGEPALRMILKVEGGQVGSCTAWENGMHDCGPAQVNSEIWVPQLAQLLDRPLDDVFHAVRDVGCFNIQAAAYILRQKIDEADGDVWDGLGRYNNAEPARKQAYQQKLIEAYKEMYGSRPPGAPTAVADMPAAPSELQHWSPRKKTSKVTVIYGTEISN
jgi:hypothetical protein